jgi:hypothetical protein
MGHSILQMYRIQQPKYAARYPSQKRGIQGKPLCLDQNTSTYPQEECAREDSVTPILTVNWRSQIGGHRSVKFFGPGQGGLP